ncbi:MAG: hypothetical protein HPY53_02175 [Brevinematales bacterium]|nr:hypothetical protein [Brevinematales bacterium]
MDKIIYLSSGDLFKSEIEKVKGGYQIFRARNLRDALIFLINNPEVGAIIYTVASSSLIDKKTMEVFFHLNPLFPVIIAQKETGKYDQNQLLEWNKNIILLGNIDELDNVLQSTQKNRRKYNRVDWPLFATFYKNINSSTTETGKILSLSAGGSYIQTTNFDMVDLNQPVYMEIHFRDFKFFVESTVVRINRTLSSESLPPGFAVRFDNVSIATQTYINHIINDHLMMTLFKELDIK